MSGRFENARILIYSHDSFGLGHLRRCRAIAHALVDRYKGLSVLILSGSPIIGSFDFRSRVDFVRIPSVVKLRNGAYIPLQLHIDLQQTLDIRASIIQQTAETFAPDLFIVDKEPLGLRGEVTETLKFLRRAGVRTVLGLRDVMDDPDLLRREWEQRGIPPLLDELYDEVWVYGHPFMGDPLDGLDISQVTRGRIRFTGYIERSLPEFELSPSMTIDEPYILVTTGGGGDGVELVDWVLRAYEADPNLPHAALVVLGPFMSLAERYGFERRIRRLERVRAKTFDSHVELLMASSVGVVAMGGYNTFCEILSLDKRAILVPRTEPRREQLLRATRAAAGGLVSMLEGDGERPTEAMIGALRRLESQPVPSQSSIDGLLGGLDVIAERVRDHLRLPPLPSIVHQRG